MRTSMLTAVVFTAFSLLSAGCHQQPAAHDGPPAPPQSAQTQATANQFVGSADMPPSEKAAIQAQMQKKNAESGAH